MPRASLIEKDVHGFVGEGHRYRCGENDYLVFRGPGRGSPWDVTLAHGKRGFGPTVVQGALSRSEALRQLEELERS